MNRLRRFYEKVPYGQTSSRVRFWTSDDDDRLRKLALAGLSVTQLALELGRSASSVPARAIKLDIAIARDPNGVLKRL